MKNAIKSPSNRKRERAQPSLVSTGSAGLPKSSHVTQQTAELIRRGIEAFVVAEQGEVVLFEVGEVVIGGPFQAPCRSARFLVWRKKSSTP